MSDKETVDFIEANNNARHYSAMRFLILPIFFTPNASSLIFLSRKDSPPPEQLHSLAAFMVIVSIIFLILEVVVNQYISHFQSLSDSRSPKRLWSFESAPAISKATPYALYAVYFFTAAFWAFVYTCW